MKDTDLSLIIRGGRLIDPANGVDRQADLLVERGRIARIDGGISSGGRVLDASDCLVVPGLVDLHAHLREPGQEHKEDIESGCAAAAAGGFTSICCMPNTDPVNDTPDVTEQINRRAAEVGRVRVHPIGAITRGLRGEDLCDFAEMQRVGIVAISDDGRCVMNGALMRRAMEWARDLDLPVIQHCEDHDLSGGGAMNEGPSSVKAALSAQPAQAESVILARDLDLVQLTGCRYHMAHVSAAPSIEHLRRAESRGLDVTCEVTPHHFTLTDEACLDRDTRTKVNPPLRSARDVEAIKEAIHDGTIDAIATDHAPHADEEKAADFEQAPFGICGLETAVPLSLNLWRQKVVTLIRLVALLTCNPALILGLRAGTLSVDAPADVTVIDPDRRWTVEPEKFCSKGHNTPFAGTEVQGAVKFTIVGGQVVFES